MLHLVIHTFSSRYRYNEPLGSEYSRVLPLSHLTLISVTFSLLPPLVDVEGFSGLWCLSSNTTTTQFGEEVGGAELKVNTNEILALSLTDHGYSFYLR